MNELALFAGGGGGLLGSKLLGWTTVCACEIDPYARDVLLGTSVHHIDETECGSWPTPTTTGNEFSPSMQKWAGHRRMMATLASRERQPSKPDRPSAQAWDELLSTTLPTPTTKLYGYNKGGAAGRVGKERPSLESLIGGVSIALREWMMGWPIGWTALESLGTDRFRMWLGSRPAYWAGEGRAA